MPSPGSVRRVTTAVLSVLIALTGLMAGGCQEEVQEVEYDALSWKSDRRMVRLDNGMVIVAKRIPTAPVASVQCWVKTGSIYEREFNGAGISHFLEHLVAGGTTDNRTEEESNRILGEMGASTNAATSLDTVRYYINTSSEHTGTAIDLMSDWIANCKITEAEFNREREVIQREFQMGQGEPGRIFWKLTQQARYTAHPARHPTIGYLDEFMKISLQDVRKFYREMYVPNNMVFVVAGDIDPDAVISQVTTLWDAKPRQNIPGIVFPNEKPLLAPRFARGTADIDRPRIRLAWPGTKLAARHDYALDLLAQVLGQGELSRLKQTIRDQKQLATSIDAYNASFSWGEGFFGVDAVVDASKKEQAKQAILEEVYRIKVIGVSDAELERAKRKTIAQVVYATQTADAAASRIASDFVHTGDPDYLDRYAEAIKHVSKADVQMAAAKFLRDDRLITIELEPGAIAEQKRTDDLVGDKYIAARRNDVTLVDLDNRNLIAKYRSYEPLPDADVGLGLALAVSPVRMITLDNGLRVIVQRNTQLPIVAMQWYHLGGQLADTPGRQGVANAMASMMMKGAGGRSADQISQTLEDLGAQMGSNSGNSTFYVTSQCLSEDWDQVLGIMADVVQRPDFPSQEWNEMRPRLLAQIDSINDTWYGQLRAEFRRNYFGPNHPWSEPGVGLRDVVGALSENDLKRFHSERIAAKDGVIAIFGDVDPDTVVSRVRELFADLPAEPKVAFSPPAGGNPSGKLSQVQTNKTLAAVQIGYGPGLARNNPDYAPMLVMTSVMSSFPVGWLDRALRGEGPGLVYAVGAGMLTGASPGYWAMLFNTHPDTVKPAIERSLSVVDRIRTEPVSEEDLARARTKVLASEVMSRQSNGQRAAAAALDELYGLGHDNQARLAEQIRSVDAATVQRVAQKYLNDPSGVVLTNKPLAQAELPSITPSGYTPTPAPSVTPAPTPTPTPAPAPAQPTQPKAQPVTPPPTQPAQPQPQPVQPTQPKAQPQPSQPDSIKRPSPMPAKPDAAQPGAPKQPDSRDARMPRRGANNPLGSGDVRGRDRGKGSGSNILRGTPATPKPSPKSPKKGDEAAHDPKAILRDEDGNPIRAKDNPLGATDPKKPVDED